MKALFVLALLVAGSAPFAPAASAAEPATKSADAAKRHPVKGVVTAVRPEQSALMVKHEAIPGVMRAMTMLFRVDEATLKQVKKGDHITGKMSHQDGEWQLRDVKLADPAPEKK